MEHSNSLKVVKGYSYCMERDMTKLIGYRVKNIGKDYVVYNKPTYIKDSGGKVIIDKEGYTKGILKPGEEVDMTSQDIIIMACNKAINFKFCNGIIAKKPGIKISSTEDILHGYYFKGNLEIEEITEKINGVTTIKEEFMQTFGKIAILG